MRPFVFVWLTALALLGLAGCAGDEASPHEPAHVSSQPWNGPQPWESAGPMGGMLPGGNAGSR